MDDNLDIFAGEPLEHFIKILPNLAPQALQKAFERLFSEYAAMNLLIEDRGLEENLSEYLYDARVSGISQDLSIRIMSEILSQGD